MSANSTGFPPEMLLSYPIFEDDQVLTSEQLNHLHRHAEEQHRFTRTRLLGIGIVAGLHVRMSAGPQITVSEGFGITSDGSIVALATSQYSHYVPLHPSKTPTGQFSGAWDLVPEGSPNTAAQPLSEFESTTSQRLAAMLAVVRIEIKEEGAEYCSGTDCDSRGRTGRTKTRVLLIEPGQLQSLRTQFPQPAGDREAFARIEIPAVQLITAISSHEQLIAIYRSSATALHTALVAALERLRDELQSSPFAAEVNVDFSWLERLTVLQNDWSNNAGLGIQFFFAFLSDLAETYNAILELLQKDLAAWNPDPDAFSDHLILGVVGPRGIDHSRTRFFPSPVTSQCVERAEYVRFLVTKMGVLVRTFSPQKGEDVPEDVRITPSHSIDVPLEERAPPWYYKHHPDEPDPVYTAWNFHRSRAGDPQAIPCYHTREYGGKGIAADPFRYALSRFPFFRIEGYLGLFAPDVVMHARRVARQNNLPIVVRQAMLTDRPGKVTEDRVRPRDFEQLRPDTRFHLSEQDKSRFLLTSFLNDYAGIEHMGGVFRGGTLLILSNELGDAVGDLTFPFACTWPDPTQHNEPLGPATPTTPQLPAPPKPIALPPPEPDHAPVSGEAQSLTPPSESAAESESLPQDYQDQLSQILKRIRDDKNALKRLKAGPQSAPVMETIANREATLGGTVERLLDLVRKRGGDLAPTAPVGKTLHEAMETLQDLGTAGAREAEQAIHRFVSKQ